MGRQGVNPRLSYGNSTSTFLQATSGELSAPLGTDGVRVVKRGGKREKAGLRWDNCGNGVESFCTKIVSGAEIIGASF